MASVVYTIRTNSPRKLSRGTHLRYNDRGCRPRIGAVWCFQETDDQAGAGTAHIGGGAEGAGGRRPAGPGGAGRAAGAPAAAGARRLRLKPGPPPLALGADEPPG